MRRVTKALMVAATLALGAACGLPAAGADVRVDPALPEYQQVPGVSGKGRNRRSASSVPAKGTKRLWMKRSGPPSGQVLERQKWAYPAQLRPCRSLSPYPSTATPGDRHRNGRSRGPHGRPFHERRASAAIPPGSPDSQDTPRRCCRTLTGEECGGPIQMERLTIRQTG